MRSTVKNNLPRRVFQGRSARFSYVEIPAPRKAVGAKSRAAPRAENVSAPAYGASEHTSPFSCKSTERAGASAGRTAEAVKALACEPTERVDASASGETEVVKALACGAAERVSASANGETEVVKAFSCRAAERANQVRGRNIGNRKGIRVQIAVRDSMGRNGRAKQSLRPRFALKEAQNESDCLRRFQTNDF